MAQKSKTPVTKTKSVSEPFKSHPKAASEKEIAIISTSDRSAFKSCRRKWNWQSHLRQGLAPKEQRLPLWFGSAMHHALEDYHGKRLYKSPIEAVEDYVQATIKQYGEDNLPPTHVEDLELMKSVLMHYTEGFLKLGNRDPYKTYKVNGEPQVEIPFEFEIPLPKEFIDKTQYSKAIYRGTIDRVVIDDDGYLWLQDYKNVARFTNHMHLELDMQIGVYLWAASYIYKRPVVGFIYTQFLKSEVKPPRILKNGDISTAADQNTTYAMYRQALADKYGEGVPWPKDNKEVLEKFRLFEETDSDKFIRRDRVYRDRSTRQEESRKIIAEVMDMLDPQLRIYPNPNYMCSAMCSFVEPCLQMDRNENYRTTLQEDYTDRTYEERNEWRKHLKVGDNSDKLVKKVTPTEEVKPNGKNRR